MYTASCEGKKKVKSALRQKKRENLHGGGGQLSQHSPGFLIGFLHSGFAHIGCEQTGPLSVHVQDLHESFRNVSPSNHSVSTQTCGTFGPCQVQGLNPQ